LCGSQAKGVLFQPASQFLPMIEQVPYHQHSALLLRSSSAMPSAIPSHRQVHESLVEKTKSIPGAKVENNKFCVSVHFRCVDEKVGTPAIMVGSSL